ncbi:hypothetical protein MODO_0866 [Myroides odoratimimus]|nr:hypothetical protein MODO_0866 [Myroides odoratimimus]
MLEQLNKQQTKTIKKVYLIVFIKSKKRPLVVNKILLEVTKH